MLELRGLKLLHISSPATSVAFRAANELYVGSEDGSVRLYNLTSTKVVKAVSKLGGEVTGIIPTSKKQNQLSNMSSQVWITSENMLYKFDLYCDKMILGKADALKEIVVGVDSDDAINDLCLSANGSVLACATDSGTVITVNTSSGQVSHMKASHSSLAGCVEFVANRPGELVSGGYDCTLYHFDHQQGITLSKMELGDLSTVNSLGGAPSFSPAFILCSAMSSNGVLAVGTADGRVWVGLGGEKGKKKSRKWNGLAPDSALEIHVIDGPVVGITFIDANTLIAVSLLGAIIEVKIMREQSMRLSKTLLLVDYGVEKVNAVASNDQWLFVCGFDGTGKGVVAIWRL